MAINVQQFIRLANFYNQTAMIMSAICVQKGGIAMENYVGRFFVAVGIYCRIWSAIGRTGKKFIARDCCVA